jgi:hypothetical protein
VKIRPSLCDFQTKNAIILRFSQLIAFEAFRMTFSECFLEDAPIVGGLRRGSIPNSTDTPASQVEAAAGSECDSSEIAP